MIIPFVTAAFSALSITPLACLSFISPLLLPCFTFSHLILIICPWLLPLARHALFLPARHALLFLVSTPTNPLCNPFQATSSKHNKPVLSTQHTPRILSCRCALVCSSVQAAIWALLHRMCAQKLLNRHAVSQSGLLGRLVHRLAAIDSSAAAACSLMGIVAEVGAFHLPPRELRLLFEVLQTAGNANVRLQDCLARCTGCAKGCLSPSRLGILQNVFMLVIPTCCQPHRVACPLRGSFHCDADPTAPLTPLCVACLPNNTNGSLRHVLSCWRL